MKVMYNIKLAFFCRILDTTRTIQRENKDKLEIWRRAETDPSFLVYIISNIYTFRGKVIWSITNVYNDTEKHTGN